MSRLEAGPIAPEVRVFQEEYKSALQSAFASRLGGVENFQGINRASKYLTLEADHTRDDGFIDLPPHLSRVFQEIYDGCPPFNVTSAALVGEKLAIFKVSEHKPFAAEPWADSVKDMSEGFLPVLKAEDRSVWKEVHFSLDQGIYRINYGKTQGTSRWHYMSWAPGYPSEKQYKPIPWQAMSDFAELPAILNARHHSQVVVHGV